MRNYTTQLLKDITDKMDLISGEEEIDYFSYLRGSDITEGMHCGGYKEAIANALSAANAFEHEIRKDAEEAKAKLTAIFLEAERADVQCYMTLREVSETLKDWMLLAQKLRLSMTGGGGYGEQLFCENNIKQWTGETAARLEKESYSAEERAEDRNEAFLAGEYTGGMPSEIKEGYIRPQEMYEYVCQPQHVDSSGEEVNGTNKEVNEALFLEVIANTRYISPELQAFYQTITSFYGATYGAGESTTQCDCGGLARGILALLDDSGLFSTELEVSANGAGGNQSWQGHEGRTTNRMFYATDTAEKSAGEIVFNSPFYEMNSDGTVCGEERLRVVGESSGLDSDILLPGDVIFYDTSGNPDDKGPDGCIDHVAIYVGETADGNKIILETGGNSGVHFGYLEDAPGEEGKKENRAWADRYIVGVKRYLPE